MTNPHKPPFDRYLDTPISRYEAAPFSGHALITLDVLRARGKGPRFLKAADSKRILYTRRHLLAWLENNGDSAPRILPLSRHARGGLND